jgi:hypothetical protein
MADQLLHGPVIEGLAVRLEGDQVVLHQTVHSIGKPEGQPATSSSQDDHVEVLLLGR